MTERCIAYRDGSICRAPATVLDTQRGGMVCALHAPPNGWADRVTMRADGTVHCYRCGQSVRAAYEAQDPAPCGCCWYWGDDGHLVAGPGQ